MAPIIELNNIGFRYPGAETWVIDNFSLAVEAGEFVAIVGGSGVGKSTILRIVAGLIAPHAGTVAINTQREPGRRRRALVFQDGRLMPWRTVRGNIGLGLEGLEIDSAEKDRRIDQVLELTGMAEFGARWPHQLSGGQVQRVGIARALAVKPDVLLMDEPFSAVDAITRRRLQNELVRIWQTSRTAVMFVTHDIEEAVFLADRVIVLGGAPAAIIEETTVPIARDERRGSEQLYRFSARIAHTLEHG